MEQAHRASELMETGTVAVNTGVVAVAEAPFGGIKQTGYGREGGSMAIKDYLNIKYTHMGLKILMRINKIKKMMSEGKPVINGWLQVPSTASAETMAQQGWDSLTIDMQHGLVDYTNALPMLQTISASDVTPLARVNWNEPGQIMKILDAGSYGIICPMVSNKQQAENFVQACMYPPNGYRSYGPVRGLIYGGPDYAKHADIELLKFAMIETKEALEKLDEIMSVEGVDGIYVGPTDLSLAIGEKSQDLIDQKELKLTIKY